MVLYCYLVSSSSTNILRASVVDSCVVVGIFGCFFIICRYFLAFAEDVLTSINIFIAAEFPVDR